VAILGGEVLRSAAPATQQLDQPPAFVRLQPADVLTGQ